MKRLVFIALVLALAGCATVEVAPVYVEPIVAEPVAPEPTARVEECDPSIVADGDGIGGTGCPVPVN